MKLVSYLREARWLDADRVSGYAKILLGLEVLFIIGIVAVGWSRGTDFLAVWTAAKMVIAGHPADAYNVQAVLDFQEAAGFPRAPFVSPPPFLALIAPLGLLSYLPAFVIWMTLNVLAYAWALRSVPRALYWPALAFTVCVVTVGSGQLGLLTAALTIGAVSCLERRKVLAGMLIGALIIKPHLAILFPLALIAGREWRAFVSAAVTVAALSLASGLLLGWDTFAAFLHQSSFTGSLVAGHTFTLSRMQSVLSLVATATGSMTLGWALQGVSTVLVGIAVYRVWSRFTDPLTRSAALCAAVPLATPYVFTYDLPLLIIPLVWLAREGVRRGFRPWERVALVLTFLSPVSLEWPLGGLHLAPVLCAGLLGAVLIRTSAFKVPGVEPRLEAVG